MSCIFDVDGEVVWSPALRIGQLFISIAQSLADAAKVDLAEAGFTMMASDYYYVDPQALATFVQGVLAGSVVKNPSYWELARGFVATCLVMLERTGTPVEVPDEIARDLAAARGVLSAMPRL